MARERLRGLYAITPPIADTAELLHKVGECIAGGAALVQYRAKETARSLALLQARALAGLCRESGVPLIINDSPELAMASGADGLHVGRDDVSAREARISLPAGIVGVSCYAEPERAAAAAAAGADYVAIGSVFQSSTKPHAVHAGLELIGRAKSLAALPVVAIGGITVDNAREVMDAGADMVAVISALFDAPDIRAAARAFALIYEP